MLCYDATALLELQNHIVRDWCTVEIFPMGHLTKYFSSSYMPLSVGAMLRCNSTSGVAKPHSQRAMKSFRTYIKLDAVCNPPLSYESSTEMLCCGLPFTLKRFPIRNQVKTISCKSTIQLTLNWFRMIIFLYRFGINTA